MPTERRGPEMPEQLIFDLPFRHAMGAEDFFVSDANVGAVAQIDRWRDWPFAKLILIGPEGSGKTHLAHVFATLTGATILPAKDLDEQASASLSLAPAVVIEDAEAIAGDRNAETCLFHLHNALAARAAPLLVTAPEAPARWGIGLPDLASRMEQSSLARLEAPDDALLIAVMLKRAADRQLPLPPAVVSFAAARIERSFRAADAFVARLDAIALSRKQRPGMAHARAALADCTSPCHAADTQAI